MAPGVVIHGHAIMSDDHCIAGPDGLTPASLRNDADWQLFQQALDAAALVVIGRLGHEANPNSKRRRRLVVSTGVRGLEQRADAAWWNPDELAWPAVCAALLPKGGLVAVPGGRRVFDLFLSLGFAEFHLVRARGVRVPGGVPIFSACRDGSSPKAILQKAGLQAGEPRAIDAAADVQLTVFRA